MRFTGFVSLTTKSRSDTIDSHTAAECVVETLAHASPRERAYFPERQCEKAKNVWHVRRSLQFHRYYSQTYEYQSTNTQLPYKTVSRDRQCTTDSRECILAARSFKGVRRVRVRASLTPPDLFGGVSRILLSLSLAILWYFLRYAALPNYACWYVLAAAFRFGQCARWLIESLPGKTTEGNLASRRE